MGATSAAPSAASPRITSVAAVAPALAVASSAVLGGAAAIGVGSENADGARSRDPRPAPELQPELGGEDRVPVAAGQGLADDGGDDEDDAGDGSCVSRI